MSEFPSEDRHAPAEASASISVGFIVLASALCGVGLLGMAMFLVTFQWVYFAALIPLILGVYMLFTRGTGPDRA